MADIDYPIHKDLSFLVGTMSTDGRDEFAEKETEMICIFADNQVNKIDVRKPSNTV